MIYNNIYRLTLNNTVNFDYLNGIKTKIRPLDLIFIENKEINNYEQKKRKTPFKCKFCKFHKIEKRKKYPLSDDMENFLKEFLHYDNTSN